MAGRKAVLTVIPKSRRLNVLGAISQRGVILINYVVSTLNRKKNEGGQGGTNAKDFRSFLLDLAPKLPRGSLLVMDNAKIHHAKLLDDTTWNLLKGQYDLRKIYLPPYSPFLNPIEFVFNHVKALLKGQEFDSEAHFQRLVKQTFLSIDADLAIKFIRHSEDFYEQCQAAIPYDGTILPAE